MVQGFRALTQKEVDCETIDGGDAMAVCDGLGGVGDIDYL